MRAPLISTVVLQPDPPWWEQWAAGFVVVMLTGAVLGPIFAPDQGEAPILRLVWPPIYLITLTLVLVRFRDMCRAWPAWIAVLLLVGLAFSSKYWSIFAEVTQRRTIAMAMTSIFAVYLGAAFRGIALPRLLMHAGLVMGVGSLVMIFAMPSIGVHSDVNAGLWRGLWYEKNQMGLVMVIAAVSAAACLAAGDPRRLIPFATLGLSTPLILGTQSKTSLLCLVLGVGLIGGLWVLRRGGPALTVVAVWLGVVAVGFSAWLWSTESGEILEALGKDPSLTGRTDIWASLMRRVAERPLTGYGYAAFWGPHSEPAAFVRQETQWIVPSAHNGWIDLLVQVGWPGTFLVGAILAIAALCLIVRLPHQGVREGWWSLSYLTVFVLLSLSESVILTHQHLPWALVLAIVARATMREPTAARAPAAALAPRPRAAYVTGSRIAAQSRHGSLRRSFPVR